MAGLISQESVGGGGVQWHHSEKTSTKGQI